MDNEARRAPKKTDQTMVEAFAKRWGNHPSFKVGTLDQSGSSMLTINHFNGPVTYSSKGFLERNLDALNLDFVTLLHGANNDLADASGVEGSRSINPFVKSLFSGKAIATQAHPRNEDTIVAAQQPVKPMRAPSTHHKGTIKCINTLKEPTIEEKEEDEQATTGGPPCITGEFRSALDTLFETLNETQVWFVFCINPNDSQLPNQLEGRSVKRQVRTAGLPEIARRCVNTFETNMTPEEFCDRYRDPLASSRVHIRNRSNSPGRLCLYKRGTLCWVNTRLVTVFIYVEAAADFHLVRCSCHKQLFTDSRITFALVILGSKTNSHAGY
jgi:chitin synthase